MSVYMVALIIVPTSLFVIFILDLLGRWAVYQEMESMSDKSYRDTRNYEELPLVSLKKK